MSMADKGLIEIIRDSAVDLIWQKAVHSSDGFRQYVYPSLPKNYDFNPDILAQVDKMISKGKSAQQIADTIYKANA